MRAGKRTVKLGVGVSQAEERAWEKAPEWDTGCMRKGPRPAGRERLPLDGAEVDRNSHLLAGQELELYPESKGNLPTCTK